MFTSVVFREFSSHLLTSISQNDGMERTTGICIGKIILTSQGMGSLLDLASHFCHWEWDLRQNLNMKLKSEQNLAMGEMGFAARRFRTVQRRNTRRHRTREGTRQVQPNNPGNAGMDKHKGNAQRNGKQKQRTTTRERCWKYKKERKEDGQKRQEGKITGESYGDRMT